MKWGRALAVACAVAVTGCGAVGPYGSTPGSQPVSTLRVGLTEWDVTTSAGLLDAGSVVMNVTNAGSVRHDLVVRGQLGEWKTPMLDPGAKFRLQVRTEPGERLHLECTVAGHHTAGMHRDLPVVPGLTLGE